MTNEQRSRICQLFGRIEMLTPTDPPTHVEQSRKRDEAFAELEKILDACVEKDGAT